MYFDEDNKSIPKVNLGNRGLSSKDDFLKKLRMMRKKKKKKYKYQNKKVLFLNFSKNISYQVNYLLNQN